MIVELGTLAATSSLFRLLALETSLFRLLLLETSLSLSLSLDEETAACQYVEARHGWSYAPSVLDCLFLPLRLLGALLFVLCAAIFEMVCW